MKVKKDADIKARIPSELRAKADAEAKKLERSLSWIVIKALERYLKGK